MGAVRGTEAVVPNSAVALMEPEQEVDFDGLRITLADVVEALRVYGPVMYRPNGTGMGSRFRSG